MPAPGLFLMKSQPPASRSSLAAAALLALAALAPIRSAAAQEAGRYTLIFGGQTYTVPYESAGGIDYLPLTTLAEVFRTPLQRDPMSGDPVLTAGRARVGVSLRQPIASIDNRVVPLDGAARQKEGAVWVSVDFVTEALAPALGEQARFDAGRRRIEVGGERPLRVVMRATSGEGGTRLTFELSRKIPYALRQSGRKLYLTLDTPSLDAPFQLEDLDTSTVRRVKLLRSEGEKGFVIELGREFSTYDLIEGATPPSLVVELRRAGHESQPLAQGPSPAAGAASGGGTGAAPGVSPGAAAGLPSTAIPPALPRESRRGDGRPVIVIDPGHGGDEKGAAGPGGLLEKDVTLDVALRLKTRLERGSNVQVMLTRDDDRAVPLPDRTAFANHETAELFVSIHANAARKADAHGAETYFLSYQATDAEAQAVAALENAQGAGGAGAQERPDLRMVLWDLAQAEHLRESSALAEMVQAELNSLMGLRDRGVRQAPFRVLMSATMPSILIEIGFITNPDEEEKLRSPAYRESLALAIAQSVQRFREDLGARTGASGGRPRTSP